MHTYNVIKLPFTLRWLFYMYFMWYFDNKDKTKEIKTQITDLHIEFIWLLRLSTVLTLGCISRTWVAYWVIFNVLTHLSMWRYRYWFSLFHLLELHGVNFELESIMKNCFECIKPFFIFELTLYNSAQFFIVISHLQFSRQFS